LGASLLQDAVGRAVSVSQNAGVRALLVHALHDRAKQFYEHYGFQESPQHPMTLMLRLNTVKDLSNGRRAAGLGPCQGCARNHGHEGRSCRPKHGAVCHLDIARWLVMLA
jgi:hypothetical protein